MKTKLPYNFKNVLWSYDFSKINPEKDKKRIIINAINYGDWYHWQWLFRHYTPQRVREIIENTPVSEFRERGLKLVGLLLNIKKMKYASRSAKIRTEKNTSRS